MQVYFFAACVSGTVLCVCALSGAIAEIHSRSIVACVCVCMCMWLVCVMLAKQMGKERALCECVEHGERVCVLKRNR